MLDEVLQDETVGQVSGGSSIYLCRSAGRWCSFASHRSKKSRASELGRDSGRLHLLKGLRQVYLLQLFSRLIHRLLSLAALEAARIGV